MDTADILRLPMVIAIALTSVVLLISLAIKDSEVKRVRVFAVMATTAVVGLFLVGSFMAIPF